MQLVELRVEIFLNCSNAPFDLLFLIGVMILTMFWLQESKSVYELTEVSTGGKLSRHNVHVQQEGPDTVTELSTFHLSIGDQLQDLHSKLVLDHPRGVSRQLHKVIVAHSLGQAVFDGNVQVNRYWSFH